jgi:hypothetical protein
VTSAVLCVVTVLLLSSATVGGQQPTQAPQQRTAEDLRKPDPGFTPPKTPWGDPDLRGIYNYGTSTPMQRPDDLTGKAILTAEEAEDLGEVLAQRIDRDAVQGKATVGGDVGNYNEAWMDEHRKNLTRDKRTSLIVDPPNGRLPARVTPTPEMKAIRDERALRTRRFEAGFMEHWQDGDVGNRCIIRRRNEGGGHPPLPAIYANVAQIFQAPGYAVIYSEMIHTARLVPLDGRPKLGPNATSWLGYPLGRWEGNTLVVETYNWRSETGFGCEKGGCNLVYGNANPKTFKIVERFTRTAADRLEYQVTIEEPMTWERPFTISVPWNQLRTEDEQIYEYACSETNYDMYHWLSQARNQESKGLRFDPNAAVRRGGGE